MIQINLLPDVKKQHLNAVKQKKVVVSTAIIASGAFLGIVILLAITVFAVQKTHISNLTDNINEDIATLQSVEDLDKVLTIQNQLAAMPALYDQKPNVTNLFDYLSVITPTNVKLTSTQATFDQTSGAATNMEISGNTETFKDANRFVDIIKNAKFKATDTGSNETVEGYAFTNVVVESISKGEQSSGGETTFTVTMAYDQAIFNSKYDKIELTVPKITSSVSSTEKPAVNNEPFQEGEQ